MRLEKAPDVSYPPCRNGAPAQHPDHINRLE